MEKKGDEKTEDTAKLSDLKPRTLGEKEDGSGEAEKVRGGTYKFTDVIVS